MSLSALLPPWAGSILCFHGIDSPSAPSRGLVSVTPRLFEDILDATSSVWRIVSLSELMIRRQTRKSTAGLLAVTFDDAYASLLPEAIPIMARRGVPATIFVVSEAATSGTPFWWDRLDDLHPRLDPQTWRTLEESIGLPDAFRRGQPASYGPLRPLRQWILAEHRGRLTNTMDRVITAAELAAGTRTIQRSMSEGELLAATRPGGIELGVHTATHAVLPLLSDAEQTAEISVCHRWLQERFPSSQPILSIPYGLYTQESLRIARDSGMTGILVLGNRTLRVREPIDSFARFCLTAQEKPWKLILRILGLPELLGLGELPWPPALPSEIT